MCRIGVTNLGENLGKSWALISQMPHHQYLLWQKDCYVEKTLVTELKSDSEELDFECC